VIKVKDIVLHTLSGLYFICENGKHERWMNMNHFYKKVSASDVPKDYFTKQLLINEQ
jgi:hypothetical protein